MRIPIASSSVSRPTAAVSSASMKTIAARAAIGSHQRINQLASSSHWSHAFERHPKCALATSFSSHRVRVKIKTNSTTAMKLGAVDREAVADVVSRENNVPMATMSSVAGNARRPVKNSATKVKRMESLLGRRMGVFCTSCASHMRRRVMNRMLANKSKITKVGSMVVRLSCNSPITLLISAGNARRLNFHSR